MVSCLYQMFIFLLKATKKECFLIIKGTSYILRFVTPFDSSSVLLCLACYGLKSLLSFLKVGRLEPSLVYQGVVGVACVLQCSVHFNSVFFIR